MTVLSAMVLAAGYGTRLRPLTEEIAKPVCPVVNRPLLYFPLWRLARLGVTEAVINRHHRPESLDPLLAEPPFGLRLRPVFEPAILGTGGGLKNARPLLENAETIVLLNGDTIGEADLAPALEQHRRSGALATLLLLDDDRIVRYGAVETDAAGAVLDIADFTHRRGERRGFFTGAHLLSPEIFRYLPSDEVFCIVRQAYQPLLAARPGRVRAVYGTGRFFDLGRLEDYLAANWSLLDDPGPFDFLPRPAATENFRPPVLRGEGALVADGASLGPYVVLGDRARVESGVRLERTVVWPGAVARESAADAVITPRRVVSSPKE